MRLYIAGPMTGFHDFNYPAFRAAETALRAAGYDVENPVDNDDGKEHPWNWFMKAALAQVIVCQGIAVLDGWHNSKGAWLEVTVAKALSMQVETVDVWLRRAETAA